METNEALLKIEEINRVIESSNKAIFSGERLIAIGVMVMLIPFIEKLTSNLTFGIEAIRQSGIMITLVHIAFYWGLSHSIGLYFKKQKQEAQNSQHPLITKAFSISKPFVVAILGTVFALASIGQYNLIYPIVYVMLGYLFSLFGRFTIPAISYIAWSYIVLGTLFIYLTKYEISYLWIIMLFYNGLTYILMGFLTRKGALAEVKK